jgi:hypothetical protein
METEAAAVVHVGYSSAVQVVLNDGALDWTRNCEEPSCGLLLAGRCWETHRFRYRLRFGTRQLQETPCFPRDLAEVAKPKAFPDDVEQIAVLGGRGVGLMFNCT